jgi:type IV pilus assembly protein PilA
MVGYGETKKRGFTLLELMITVAILGILAAVAIPAFMNYMRKTKTSEALVNIKAMYHGAIAYFGGENINGYNNYMPANAPMTPSTVSAAEKNEITPTTMELFANNPTWLVLGFAPTRDFYYSYSFQSDCPNQVCTSGNQITCAAYGNLDGDEGVSTFTHNNRIVDGQLVSLGISTVNELE